MSRSLAQTEDELSENSGEVRAAIVLSRAEAISLVGDA